MSLSCVSWVMLGLSLISLAAFWHKHTQASDISTCCRLKVLACFADAILFGLGLSKDSASMSFLAAPQVVMCDRHACVLNAQPVKRGLPSSA